LAEDNRRPITSRDSRWARSTAAFLLRRGLRPNHISVASVFMAAAAGACLIAAGHALSPRTRALLYVAAAAFIQLRLLCNLFDGMLAVEGGLKSKSGEIFNDLPDRLADPLILICAGYSVTDPSLHGIEIGYLAALLAVLTAYVRVLGASAGAGHFFIGPMAKQHRMAMMTLACLASIPQTSLTSQGRMIAAALALIVAGCVVTTVRRIVRIVRQLESQ
jgi:phosphatidylglycerophosphate synthase